MSSVNHLSCCVPVIVVITEGILVLKFSKVQYTP